jgi:integrase
MSLRELKLASNSIKSRLNPIFHFYEMNDVSLNKKKIKMFKGEFVKKSRDRAYTDQEIKKVLDVSDLRMKIVVLLMASAGCRVGALPSLRLRNLERVDGKTYRITMYEGSNEQYSTFCTPECASFIDAYLEYRKSNGEKLNPDSYLIRDQFDITDIEQIRNKSRGVSIHTFQGIVDNALLKAGLRTTDHTSLHNRKEIMKCHEFRKFFTNQTVNSKINPEIREMLLGHKIGLAPCYYRPTEKEMHEEYQKAIDLLNIDHANRLQRKIETLSVEKSRLDRIEEKMKLMESMFQK